MRFRRHPHDRVSIDTELGKRRKHLAIYILEYQRVFDVLFDTILKAIEDLEPRVMRIRYHPNSRVMEVGIAWKQVDGYARSVGFFSLWRNGIFFSTDIQRWPKVAIRDNSWSPINDMTDDQIVERILSCIGAPWAKRFSMAPEVGAFRYDVRQLRIAIENVCSAAPLRHKQEIEDLAQRIKDFSHFIDT